MRVLPLVLASVVLFGCAGIPRVQATGTMVDARVDRGGRGTFLLAHVHADRDQLRVHGRVRSRVKGALLGHVDVEVTDPLGELLDVLHIRLVRKLGARAYRLGAFDIRLPVGIPPGASARFVYQRSR